MSAHPDPTVLDLSTFTVRVYEDGVELDADGPGTWTLTVDDLRAMTAAVEAKHGE